MFFSQRELRTKALESLVFSFAFGVIDGQFEINSRFLKFVSYEKKTLVSNMRTDYTYLLVTEITACKHGTNQIHG